MHATSYGMPMKKAEINITAYIGGMLDWRSITGESTCVGLLALQAGKKLILALAHYLFVLYPPHSYLSLETSSPPCTTHPNETPTGFAEKWSNMGKNLCSSPKSNGRTSFLHIPQHPHNRHRSRSKTSLAGGATSRIQKS